MMALGGASKRGELTSFNSQGQSMTNQMGKMNIDNKQDLSTMNAQEQKIAQDGDKGQGDRLRDAKRKATQKK